MDSRIDSRIKDVNLLLIYLTGWEEDCMQDPKRKIFKSWRGYIFELLRQMERDKMIRQIYDVPVLMLTESGKREAELLRKKYVPGVEPINEKMALGMGLRSMY